MLSIGEFSHVCQLSVKTIRYYQELGLLEPAKTDAISGYRFYDDENYERITSIILLKDMGFTLKEIKSILDQCEHESDLHMFIEDKLNEIEKKLNELKIIKDRLSLYKSLGRDEARKTPAEIVETDFYIPLYAARPLTGTYDIIGRGLNYLYKKLGRYAQGKPYAFYDDLEYSEDLTHFRAVVEISRDIKTDGAVIAEFPKTRAVKLLHTGNYGSQGPVYSRLFNYCRDKGYEIVPPIIEHFIKGPGMIFRGNPELYQTECIVLIK